jgi:hypothetical protein
MNRRLIGVALMVGVATGLVTACSDSGSSDESAAGMAVQSDGAGDAAATGQPQKPGAVGEVRQPGVDRTLVRTATIELSAGDVLKTVDQARDIAATEGGYAGKEDVRDTTATLVLHIPSDRFDGALDDLSKLGRVTSREQSAEDVTEQVVDLESRIASQRASVDRVRTLLARASTVDEIVRIEQELTTREADLESLEQRRQALAGQVAMSTVTMGITKSDAPPPPAPQESSGFVAGLSDGWHAFLDAGAVTLRVVGAVLPFAVVLGIPAAFVFRWRRRRTTASAVQQP